MAAQHAEAEASAERCRNETPLKQDGWTILRFWNDDVLRDIDDVCQHIVIAAGLCRRAMPRGKDQRNAEMHP